MGISAQHPACMANQEQFIDYYDLMQISPKAELETIKRVYKMLVARLHPDNAVTGDAEAFIKLRRGFEVLSDSQTRAAYDAEYAARIRQPLPRVEPEEFATGVDAELCRRVGLLCLLYKQRQTNPARPGLSLLELEQATTCPQEFVSFTLWYLQSKNYVSSAENSDFVITPAGIDYLEANPPECKAQGPRRLV
jgi:curved DNA-binding protein CbpA